MLYEVVNDFPNEIIYEEEGPFISLYQPTHRHRPENKQDLIRFENLIQDIENSLLKKHSKLDVAKRLKPLRALSKDRIFWNNTADGLAILSSEEKTIIYKLQRKVEELAVVANSFHIKPLIRTFQSVDRYHVLGINRNNFTLYEGDRYGFQEVDIDSQVPRTAKEVLGDEYEEAHLSQRSQGGASDTPMYHGHGGRKDEVSKDTERYFRYVDRFILEKYSNPMDLPLILAGLDEHHGLFRNISNNNHLLEKGIKSDYETLEKDQVREEAWKVIEPYYLQKTDKLVEEYKLKQSKFLASDDLAEVARSAIENRVDKLLIESDRIIPGKIDKETGKLTRGDLENPQTDDVLDDIGEIVLKNKGEVVVLPKDKMPSSTGVVAIYRY